MTQEESRPAVTGALPSEGASQETGSGLNQCGICEGSGRLVRTLERGEVSSDCGNCGGAGVLPARPAVEEGPREGEEIATFVEAGEVADAVREIMRAAGAWNDGDALTVEERLVPVVIAIRERAAARPLVQEDDAAPHSFVAASDADILGRPFCVVCGNREPNPLHEAPADDPRDEDDDVEAALDDYLACLDEHDAKPHALAGIKLEHHACDLCATKRIAYTSAIERRRGVAVPQAGTFTALEAARLAVGFGDGEDYCGSCGAHWRDIQNGCRLHPLWNVLASTEAERAVQAGGGDDLAN